MHTIKTSQPVKRSVVRGALENFGFRVGRIRSKYSWDDDHPVVYYDVEIYALDDVDSAQVTPAQVRKTAAAAFTLNIDVTEVKFDSQLYHVKMVTWSEGCQLEDYNDGHD